MNNLKDSLEQLHNELRNAKEVDPESAEILRNLISDIQNILERLESNRDVSEEHHNILEELKESAQKFELTHPELSGAIRIVINSFSNIGA